MEEPRRVEYLPKKTLEFESDTADGIKNEARQFIGTRIAPALAFEYYKQGATIIDTRPVEQREQFGVIPQVELEIDGKTQTNNPLYIHPNHLLWRADMQEPSRCPEIPVDEYADIFILCQQGYSSSIMAALIKLLGYHKITDIAGGFEAWKAARLPCESFTRDI